MKPAKDPIERKEIFWTPLDNAAKIFPAIRSNEHTIVIRLTAELKERVAIKPLFAAISQVEKRFPYFKVCLRKGFFWYYLEQIDQLVTTAVDKGVPCKAFRNQKNNKLLYRILVYKNRISAEFSHILTDGYGASTFFNSLLLFYFREKGVLSKNITYNLIDAEVEKEEYEDSYNKYFKENIPPVIKQSEAFHLPFPLKNKPRFNVLAAILSVKDLKSISDERGVSITDYLVAVYLWSLQSVIGDLENQKIFNKKKILRVQVPINLRNIYPSKTRRNFSLFVLPEIDLRLGYYSFDEIVKIVYHKMQLETDEKLVNKIISRNVGSEKKLIVRGIPLLLKSLVLYLKYFSEGANQYSGVLTNLGRLDLPDAISENIKYYIFTPPPPNKKLKVNCGVIGFQDKLVLSFGNITKSKAFERKFINFLVQQGIKIKLLNY